MKIKHPQRITISDMRNIVTGSKIPDRDMPMINKNFAMINGGRALFDKVMHAGTPYLVEDTRIGFINSGSMHIVVNLMEYTLTRHTIMCLGIGSIVQINEISDDFKITGMAIKDDSLNIALNGHLPIAFNGQNRDFHLMATEKEVDIINGIFQSIWEVVHQENYSKETVNSLIASVFHYYNNLESKTESVDIPKSRDKDVFDRFIYLVNRYNEEERFLSFYADKLCLSQRYLGTIIKTVSGVTAKDWIDRAVITTAKVMLKHSDMQIVQLSDKLRFPSTSFFCKYFKRLTGMTPQEYRDS